MQPDMRDPHGSRYIKLASRATACGHEIEAIVLAMIAPFHMLGCLLAIFLRHVSAYPVSNDELVLSQEAHQALAKAVLDRQNVTNERISNVPSQIATNLTQDASLGSDYPPVIAQPDANQRTIKDGEIPQYVIENAPYVWLHSQEKYFPGDIAEYVPHFDIRDKDGKKQEFGGSVSDLLKIKDEDVFLTAKEDWLNDPDWIIGSAPDADGLASGAPATLIVMDKGNGWVDAYWFYYYPFNEGPPILDFGAVGNHLGDWEHTLVRFYNEKPVLLWLSAHDGGGGGFYDNFEKDEHEPSHPLVYSALGTHANYADGKRQIRDPTGTLYDDTDRGKLWKPSKSYLAYTYDGNTVFDANNDDQKEKYGSWLTYPGRWGNMKLPRSDPRQKEYLPGVWRYVDGPTGPLSKNLLRISPCAQQPKDWWKVWAMCDMHGAPHKRDHVPDGLNYI